MSTNGQHHNSIPQQGELPLPPARGPAKGFKRSPEWRRARVLETLAKFRRPRSIYYIRSHMPRPAVGPVGIEAALVELERRGRVRRRPIVVQGVERDGWELVRDEAPATAPEPERHASFEFPKRAGVVDRLGLLSAALGRLKRVADAALAGEGLTLEDAVRWWMDSSDTPAAKASDDLFALAAVLAREAEKGGAAC